MTKLRRDYVTSEVWRHNGLQGQVRMARMAMQEINVRATTTTQTKQLARRIAFDLQLLQQYLITRYDRPSAFQETEK